MQLIIEGTVANVGQGLRDCDVFQRTASEKKTPFRTAVTLSGIVILAKDSQFAKALSSMLVIDSEIAMLAKDLQY